MTAPPLTCSIDLEAPGKRIGHLELVWSDNRHAYGIIPVPIAVIAHGDGPTALVTAGVHGDEYEGLVIARRLIRDLEPSMVTGRIVVMPAVNLPAVRSGERVSPLDGENMNRAFPGKPGGAPTAAIADFIERRLLPETNVAIDLHSGGTQSIFTPCGYIYGFGDRDFRARKLAAAHAFGAPMTVVVAATSSGGSLSAACERHGIPMVATELGGAGILDRTALGVGHQGTLAVLRHAGILAGDAAGRRTRLVHVASRRTMVLSPADGLLEQASEPGDVVEPGQLAGRIWPLDDPSRAPVDVTHAVSGVVVARRATPLVQAGDAICHTGTPLADAAFLEPEGSSAS